MFFKAVSIGNYVCHFCKSISCQLWGISDARLQHMAKFLVPYLRPTKSQLSGVGPSNVFKNHTPYISFFFPPTHTTAQIERGNPAYEITAIAEKIKNESKETRARSWEEELRKKAWNISLHSGAPQLNGRTSDSVVASAAALTPGT